MAASLQNTEVKSGTGSLSMTLVSWPNPNGAAILLVQSAALYDSTALASLSSQGFTKIAEYDGGTFCGQIFARTSVPVGVDTPITVPDSGDHTIAMLTQWDSTTSAPLGVKQAKFGNASSFSASGTYSFSDLTSTTVADAPMLFGLLNYRDLASTTIYSNPTQGSFSYTPAIITQQNFTDGTGGGVLFMVCGRGSPGRIDLPTQPTIDYSAGATHWAVPWYVELYEVPPPTITSASNVPNAIGTQLAHALTANQTVTWSIVGGTHAADFEISGSTLRWVSNGVSGSTGNKLVTVRATNVNGSTTDQAITVPVYIPFTGPTFGAITAGFGNSGTINLTITAIRGLGRMMTVAVMTANQVPANVAGWTKLVPDSGSTARGSAGVAGGLLGTIYYRISDGTETTFACPDSGDIQYVVGWSYVPDTGKTIEFGPSIANNFTAGTAGSFPGVTTLSDDHAVVTVLFTDRDSAAARWTPTSYGNSANGSERFDAGTTTGTGGGIAVLTSEKQAAGALGTTTATQAASSVHSYITFTLRHASSGTIYNDSLTETAAAAESAATTAAWSSSRTETAASAAAQSASHAMAANLSEVAAATEARSAGLAYSSPLTETVGAAEASQTTALFASTITEAATSADSCATTATFTASSTESVAGSDARATAATWPTTRAESVAANDNAVAGSILSGSRSESVSAQDSASAANTITRSLSEQATAAANQTAAATFPSALAETISADDDAVGNVVGGATTYDDVLSENVSATDAAAISFVAAAVRVETLAAAVAQSTTGIWSAARSETVNAADTAQAGSVIATGLTESSASTAAQIVAGVFGYGLAETVGANDDQQAATLSNEALFETALALDSYEVEGGELPIVPPERHLSGSTVDRNLSGSIVSRHAEGQAPPRHLESAPSNRSLTAVTVRRTAA